MASDERKVSSGNEAGLFGGAPAEEPRSWTPIAIGIAAVALVVIVLTLMFSGRDQSASNAPTDPNQPTRAAKYAENLPISDVKMATSQIGTGGQIYYVTGKIANTGSKTVTGASVELLFRDNLGKVCQRESEPLRVVTQTEPALDVADLSRVPLKPAQSRDFQITLEHVSQDWNGQYPQVTITRVTAQ